MRIDATSIDDYFVKSGEREQQLRQIDELIVRAAPRLERTFFASTSMTAIAYGLVDYQTKSMKVPQKWPLIALANQKNHISVYVCAVENGEYIAEKNADRLGRVSCGKSCIRFKNIDDIDLAVLEELIKNVATRFAAGERLFGL